MCRYHLNSLGSVYALTDNNGAVVERYSYDAYGKTTIWDETMTDNLGENEAPDQEPVGNPYMFTGRRWDNETSLYYYRARMYDPVIGRFLSHDPLGYKDSMNLYEYCVSNPVNRIDPMGKYVNSEEALNNLNKVEDEFQKNQAIVEEYLYKKNKLKHFEARLIIWKDLKDKVDSNLKYLEDELEAHNRIVEVRKKWDKSLNDLIEKTKYHNRIVRAIAEHNSILARSFIFELERRDRKIDLSLSHYPPPDSVLNVWDYRKSGNKSFENQFGVPFTYNMEFTPNVKLPDGRIVDVITRIGLEYLINKVYNKALNSIHDVELPSGKVKIKYQSVADVERKWRKKNQNYRPGRIIWSDKVVKWQKLRIKELKQRSDELNRKIMPLKSEIEKLSMFTEKNKKAYKEALNALDADELAMARTKYKLSLEYENPEQIALAGKNLASFLLKNIKHPYLRSYDPNVERSEEATKMGNVNPAGRLSEGILQQIGERQAYLLSLGDYQAVEYEIMKLQTTAEQYIGVLRGSPLGKPVYAPEDAKKAYEGTNIYLPTKSQLQKYPKIMPANPFGIGNMNPHGHYE